MSALDPSLGVVLCVFWTVVLSAFSDSSLGVSSQRFMTDSGFPSMSLVDLCRWASVSRACAAAVSAYSADGRLLHSSLSPWFTRTECAALPGVLAQSRSLLSGQAVLGMVMGEHWEGMSLRWHVSKEFLSIVTAFLTASGLVVRPARSSRRGFTSPCFRGRVQTYILPGDPSAPCVYVVWGAESPLQTVIGAGCGVFFPFGVRDSLC